MAGTPGPAAIRMPLVGTLQTCSPGSARWRGQPKPQRPGAALSQGQRGGRTAVLCHRAPLSSFPSGGEPSARGLTSTFCFFLPFPASVLTPLPGFSWDQHPNTLLRLEPLSWGQLPGPVPSCRWGGLAPVMPPRVLAACLQAVKGAGRDPEAPAAICTRGCPWSPLWPHEQRQPACGERLEHRCCEERRSESAPRGSPGTARFASNTFQWAGVRRRQ